MTIPYDPNWTFTQLVEELSLRHRPGSVTSGKARNVLLEAWGLHVGGKRATREINDAIRRHGSIKAAATAFSMSHTTLRELRDLFESMPEPGHGAAELPSFLSGELDPLRSIPPGDLSKLLSAIVAVFGEKDVSAKISAGDISKEFVMAFRSAARLAELRRAVDELRANLDGGEDSEGVYQDWCDQHSWAFGHAYVARDLVRRVSAGDQVDMLLDTLSGFRDIVELKRPNMPVLHFDKAHKNFYFSSEATMAIGQCHRYLDVLQEEAGKGLRDHPHIVAYHPHATIVIGRSLTWSREQVRALHGLNRRLHGITLITYDHLLAQCEQLLRVLSDQSKHPEAGE